MALDIGRRCVYPELVYVRALTNMRPISHAFHAERHSARTLETQQKSAFCVSGVPFALDESSAAMFLPANEKRECAFEDGAASLIAGTGTNGQQGKHSVRPTLRAPGRGMRYYGGDAAWRSRRAV